MPEGSSDLAAESSILKLIVASEGLLMAWDFDGTIRQLSCGWHHVLGWRRDEMIGRRTVDLVHPDDAAAMHRAIENASQSESIARFSNRFACKGGGWQRLEWCAVTCEQDGLIYASVRATRDEDTDIVKIMHRNAEVEAISGVGSYEVDLLTGDNYWSPVTCAIHDLPADEPPTMDKALCFYPPEARAVLDPALTAVQEDGTPYDLELPFITAKGRRLWVRTTGAAEIREGKVVRFYGTFEDITERREDRDRLSDFADIVELAHDGIWVIDLKGHTSYANPRMAEMLGLSVEAMIGRPFTDFMDAGWRETAQALFAERAAGAAERDDFRLQRTDGTPIWVSMSARPRMDAGGEMVSAIVMVTDITARKAQEEELQNTRARLQATFDALPDTLLEVDAEGRFTAAHRGRSDRFIMPLDAFLGRTPEEVLPPELAALARRAMAGAAQSGWVGGLRYRMDMPDGPGWFELSAAQRTTGHQGATTGFVSVIRDITERVEAEEGLREREALYSALVELSPIGIALNDMETGAFLDLNPALLTATGYTRAEFTALSYWDVTPQEYAEAEALALADLRDTGRYGPFEKHYIRKDGTRYPVRLRGMRVTGRDGRDLIWSLVEDISDERTQRAEVERLGDVARFTNNLVVIADREGLIEWVNPAFEARTGWLLHEVRGRAPGSFLQSEQTDPATIARIAQALRAVAPVEVDILNRSKSGQDYWLRLEIQPRHDKHGRHIGFIAVETDITEYKRHQDIMAVVADFSRRLLHSDDLDSERNRMLAEAGQVAGVNRAYAFMLDSPVRIGDMQADWIASQVFEWCDGSAEPQINNPDLQNVNMHESGLHRFSECFAKGAPFVLESPEQMTEGERRLLLPQRIAALCCYPIITDGRCVGFFGFDICSAPDAASFAGWSPEVMDALSTTANNYASALERQTGQTTLVAAVNALKDGFVQFDADERLVLANRRYRELHAANAQAIVKGARFEDILRSGLKKGCYADAVGREDAWLHERLSAFRSQTPMVNRLADGTILQVIEQRTPDGGRVGLRVDVTELYRAQDAARSAGSEATRMRHQLVDAVEALEDGFLLFDAEDRLILANQRYKEMYPLTAPAVVPGASFEDILRHAVVAGEIIDPKGRDPETWIRDALERRKQPHAKVVETFADGTRIQIRDTVTREGGRVGLRVDVTELMQAREHAETAEADAARARAQMVNAVEALPDGFLYFDSDQRLVLCNESHRRLFDDGEAIFRTGTSYTDILRAVVASGHVSKAVGREDEWMAEQLAMLHETEQTEEEVELTDGRVFRMLEHRTPDGGMVALRTDITALSQTRRRLQAIIEGAGAGTWEWDLDTGATEINARWAGMLGYDLAELTPMHVRDWLALIHPEDFPKSDPLVRKVISGEAQVYHAEFRMRHKDGHWVWIQSRGRVSRWTADGNAQVMSGVHLDISAVKAAEQEAARARAQLLGAIDALDDGFVMYDADDRLVLANRRYREFYAASAPAMTEGMRFEDILRHGLECGQYAEAIGREEEWLQARLSAHRAQRPVQQTLSDGRVLQVVERETADGGRVGLRVDITDLINAREAAEAASRAKSEFLANMSHEIRTPLNGVLGMADIMRETHLDDDQRTMLDTIRESGWSLLALLNDILDLARVESGKLALEHKPFELSDLIERLAALHGPNARAKGIAFDVLQSAMSGNARLGDETRVMQVLHNLIGNAVKFTEHGTVTLEVHANDLAQLRFIIRDTGIGMSPEQLTHIFGAFEQAEAGTARRFGGSGLGMTIVRKLLDLMDGRIRIDSTPGQGTVVEVLAPLQAVTDPKAPTEELPTDSNSNGTDIVGLRGRRVLVADDNATNRKILAVMLAKLGLDAVFAENGAEACDLWRAQTFDLMLLDISMPVMDGIEAFRVMQTEARTSGRPLPVAVAATANVMTNHIAQYRDEGFTATLAKPIRRQHLEELLTQLLAAEREDRATIDT
ncbi:MAG: PAS domain S-box protein [Rhodobacteraceae bacterium]|nr:PAS domain S-box protein [Paracoccaceae bacterium]